MSDQLQELQDQVMRLVKAKEMAEAELATLRATCQWQPIDTIPMDGTEILIKTDSGIVSTWFCNEPPTNDARDNGEYDWVCYDDAFQIDGNDNNIEAWMPLPSADYIKSMKDGQEDTSHE